MLYVPAAPVVPALNSYWKWIHVTTIALSSSVLMVSGAASVLYLLRGRDRTVAARSAAASTRGRSGTSSGGIRRQRLDRRVRLDARPAAVDWRRWTGSPTGPPSSAFPVYTFAVIAGAMWAEVAWGRYWGWDPKETCAFVTWVIYAAYLHARSTAGWRGRRAAWISVVGFASILFNLFFVNMVVSGLHSYAGLN